MEIVKGTFQKAPDRLDQEQPPRAWRRTRGTKGVLKGAHLMVGIALLLLQNMQEVAGTHHGPNSWVPSGVAAQQIDDSWLSAVRSDQIQSKDSLADLEGRAVQGEEVSTTMAEAMHKQQVRYPVAVPLHMIESAYRGKKEIPLASRGLLMRMSKRGGLKTPLVKLQKPEQPQKATSFGAALIAAAQNGSDDSTEEIEDVTEQNDDEALEYVETKATERPLTIATSQGGASSSKNWTQNQTYEAEQLEKALEIEKRGQENQVGKAAASAKEGQMSSKEVRAASDKAMDEPAGKQVVWLGRTPATAVDFDTSVPTLTADSGNFEEKGQVDKEDRLKHVTPRMQHKHRREVPGDLVDKPGYWQKQRTLEIQAGNVTIWGPQARAYMAELPVEIFTMAEHRQIGKKAATMHKQLEGAGWKAAIEEATAAAADTSGGVLIAWKEGLAMRGVDLDLPKHCRGRLVAAELQLKARLKVLMVCIYVYTGDKDGANNLTLLESLGPLLSCYEGWCVGGDWNIEPHLVAGTGWLNKIKGIVLQQDSDTLKGTCFTGGKNKPSYLDYFVVSSNLERMFKGAGIDRQAPFGTHRVVCAKMACNPCRVLVPMCKKVKDIPDVEAGKVGCSWQKKH